jgi:hypothetical protein
MTVSYDVMRHYLDISATAEIYGEIFQLVCIFNLQKTLKGFCWLLEHFVLLSLWLVTVDPETPDENRLRTRNLRKGKTRAIW